VRHVAIHRQICWVHEPLNGQTDVFKLVRSFCSARVLHPCESFHYNQSINSVNMIHSLRFIAFIAIHWYIGVFTRVQLCMRPTFRGVRCRVLESKNPTICLFHPWAQLILLISLIFWLKTVLISKSRWSVSKILIRSYFQCVDKGTGLRPGKSLLFLQAHWESIPYTWK